jgi:hypothetical protein
MQGQDNGSHYSGMSYEDGIQSAINWLIGDTDDSPMD